MRGMNVRRRIYIDEATLIPEGFWTQFLARLSVPGSVLFVDDQPRLAGALAAEEIPAPRNRRRSAALAFHARRQPGAGPGVRFVTTSRRTSACGIGGSSSATGVSRRALSTTCSTRPSMSSTSCRRWRTGCASPSTTARRTRCMRSCIGLGMDGTLYVVTEWRWDSRQQGRQMTDVEYSRALRDWLNTVKLPSTEFLGPRPRFMVADPSATVIQGSAVPGRMGGRRRRQHRGRRHPARQLTPAHRPAQDPPVL